MRRAFIFAAIVAIAILLLMYFNGFFMHGDPQPVRG
jgi:hypothetical protein